MSEKLVRRRNDRELRDLAGRIVSSVGEALGSATGRPVGMSLTDDVAYMDVAGWIWLLDDPQAVMLVALDHPFAGQFIRIVLGENVAIALSNHLFRSGTDASADPEQSESSAWHLEMFRAIGVAVCESIHSLLGATLGTTEGVRLESVGIVRPGFDGAGLLGSGEQVFYGFKIQTEENPGTIGWLVLDGGVAKQWNDDQDVFLEVPEGEPEGENNASAESQGGVEADEDIPQAPIRGRLTVYLTGRSAVQVLRQCARRIGFEIDARPTTEIPNPAAFSDQTLLIEIPADAKNRLDWARRIKQQNARARVILLLHEPTRANVMAALETKADVLVAWPVAEPELSIKLEPMFPI